MVCDPRFNAIPPSSLIPQRTTPSYASYAPSAPPPGAPRLWPHTIASQAGVGGLRAPGRPQEIQFSLSPNCPGRYSCGNRSVVWRMRVVIKGDRSLTFSEHCFEVGFFAAQSRSSCEAFFLADLTASGPMCTEQGGLGQRDWNSNETQDKQLQTSWRFWGLCRGGGYDVLCAFFFPGRPSSSQPIYQAPSGLATVAPPAKVRVAFSIEPNCISERMWIKNKKTTRSTVKIMHFLFTIRLD